MVAILKGFKVPKRTAANKDKEEQVAFTCRPMQILNNRTVGNSSFMQQKEREGVFIVVLL